MDTTEIKRIREYYKNCTPTLDNQEETDKFQETYSLSTLNHGETENLNKPINTKETESIIKTSHQRKTQG